MSKAEMMEMANLIKKYMENELPKQMRDAWENGDSMKSCNLSKARQNAFNLLKVISEE